ncbi:MAG: DNA topoisomerase [Proteobacteria bacterium]|nr:DNA topoisomerase [Pseudomonadota bacterium]
MSKTLIITEKPSVARDIVAALGGFKVTPASNVPHKQSSLESRNAQIWESDQFICTHALGHLLELYEPEDYLPQYKTWNIKDLPIVPASFLLKPKSETAPILKTIRLLMSRPDVDHIINACDAAREGELIFRELMEHCKNTRPISRVWLQSMTPESIRSTFASLRPGLDYVGLSNAAASRSQADWLVGMNLSRALTLKLSRASEPGAWSAGRVQTPTLAMLVDREFQILSHDPRPFHILKATFKAVDHEYEGTWIKTFNKTEHSENAKYIFEYEQAQSLVQRLQPGSIASASEIRKSREQKAPRLFQLTSLQRYMATHHRWSAKQTLTVAQKCYETHKILTYPRTESDCLPDDYKDSVKTLIQKLSSIEVYRDAAVELLTNPWHNVETVFDSSKVSDHFAIIPTGVLPSQLPSEEGILFDAVIRRTLSSLMPPAIIDQVSRTTVVDHETFLSGPEEVVRVPGWQKIVHQNQKNQKKEFHLKPLLSDSASVELTATNLKEDKTKPPPRIGEAQLLTMMEFAGRHIDDPDMAKVLNATGGLGTAATRAEIIENLKHKNYVFPNLQPTVKGLHLIRYLKLARAENLTSPQLTAELEKKLSDIEHGRCTKDLFLDQTVASIHESLQALERFDLVDSFKHAPPLGMCPKCSKDGLVETSAQIHERMWNYSCSSNFSEGQSPCGYTMPKELEGRYLDPNTVKRLLADKDHNGILVEGFPSLSTQARRTGASKSEASSAGQDFSGVERRLLTLKYGLIDIALSDGSSAGESNQITLRDGQSQTRRTTWGNCPIHVGDSCLIIETKKALICESRLRNLKGGGDSSHGFYLPKELCGRVLRFDEIHAFIKEGRTKKIEDFKSKAGKPFQATVIRTPSGSWVLEF